MPHKIEVSPSGRATCKTCAAAIAKGELRFGEAYSSQFTDEAFRWHHLNCAAKKLPHQLAETLPTYVGEIPNRAELDATLAEAKETVKVKAKATAKARTKSKAKATSRARKASARRKK